MGSESLKVVKRWVGTSQPWTSDFLRTVQDRGNITTVVVLGSAIRPRGHRRSDLDLLVLYEGQRPNLHAPIEVDIRLYPVVEIDELIATGHEILCWALKFGVILFDRNQTWFTLLDKWKNWIPLPSETDAHSRGKASLERAKEMDEVGDESAASDLVLAAATQFVREKLIHFKIFPASRPELPNQLRDISPRDALADILEDAMFGDDTPADLIERLHVAGFH